MNMNFQHSPNQTAPFANTGSQFLATCEQEIRLGFVRKVFGILSIQLLVTLAITAVCVGVDSVRDYIHDNAWVYWLSFAFAIGSILTLVCTRELARKYPQNYVLLTVFTLSEGFFVGAVSSFYDIDAVIMALGATTVVVFGLMFYAKTTKRDFTMIGGVLVIALLMMIMVGFAFWFIESRTMEIIYASAGATIFSIFIVHDTQLILGGKHKMQFSTEDYVFAAISLYLDIINLFLYLLILIGGGNDR